MTVDPDDLTTPEEQPEESELEASLRPRNLTEFVGQVRVREQLELVLTGAKLRGTVPDHVLLAGPPGLGKTSLAMIIAAELGTSLRITSGPALERAGDLAAMLSNLVEGDVLFIDEIHRIARPAEEMLYLAMEDFRVDIVVGKGPGRDVHPARHRAVHPGRGDHQVRPAHVPPAGQVRLHRPHGVLLGRGTGPGADPQRRDPRRRPASGGRGGDRPALAGHAADRQPAAAPGPRLRPGAGRRHRHAGRSPEPLWRSTTSTSWGWTGSTGRCSARCAARSAAAPSGLTTLAVAVGEEATTVEEVCEPFLVRIGMLARTPRGRVATPAAWEHLGVRPTPGARQPAALFDDN